jgi:hypothetical protein
MIGLLPWEKWLPPWLYGPLVCGGSIWILVAKADLAWWEYVLLAAGILWGAFGTLRWFIAKENVFGGPTGEETPKEDAGPK